MWSKDRKRAEPELPGTQWQRLRLQQREIYGDGTMQQRIGLIQICLYFTLICLCFSVQEFFMHEYDYCTAIIKLGDDHFVDMVNRSHLISFSFCAYGTIFTFLNYKENSYLLKPRSNIVIWQSPRRLSLYMKLHI